MTDSWTDSNGDNIPSDWTPGGPLTPADEWASGCGCAPPSGPSIADSVTITGSPGAITSVQNGKSLWSLVLNDGTPAADFRIDRFDNTGALADSPMTIVRATGVVSFNDPVMLAADPVEPLEAATKQYVDENASGIPDAPDNQTYGRALGAWNLVVPASGGTFTGQTNLSAGGAVTGGALLFAGSAVCSVPTIAQLQIGGGSLGQVPATDGAGNLSWVTPVTGGPYLPIAGGTVTGSLTVNQVLTVQGSNSFVLNAPVTGGSQRAILGQAANITRWQLMLGDGTAEGAGNAGANFSLSAYGVAGAFLGNWLTIARADGSTVFNGSGVTIQGGLAVNGLLALAGPGNLAIYGGSNGQVLTTNGSGILSWTTPSGGGGISDAPNDGTAYARKSLGWAHLTHTDITDWTATLAPYALATSVPIASSTLPLASGVAAVGTSTTYARADHVHPTTAMGDNRILNGDFRIDQRNAGASGTANNAYTVDRWYYVGTQTGRGTWQRNVAAVGFGASLSFATSSAYTLLATDAFSFSQSIEADMVSDFQWGTVNAQPVTLSFWLASNQTGTFTGAIRSYGGARSYPFTFSVPNSNWQKVVITIPGDTAGTWVMSGNAGALVVVFDLGSGTNSRGPANAWASASYNGATGAVNIASIAGATFYLTGVKLEIGSVATPYNRQSLAKSMADCQRYYQKLGGAIASDLLIQGYTLAGTALAVAIGLPVSMRATPTAAISAPFAGSNVGTVNLVGGLQTLVVQLIGTATGNTVWNNTSTAMYVTLNAEL